jgi:hypothetical protein
LRASPMSTGTARADSLINYQHMYQLLELNRTVRNLPPD